MSHGFATSTGALPAARARILPQLAVPLRDGVELCTDVYLPAAEEPRPAVVVRTPYGRSRPFIMHLAQRLSGCGFCCVAQDCRGRHGSGGTYNLDLEEPDTRDTLTWLGEQAWSSGKVALLGISVSSFPNLRVAASPPPAGIEIAALVSLMGVVDLHSLFYRGGALVLHWALPWVTLMSASHRGGSPSWLRLPWPEIFRSQPLVDLPRLTQGNQELWQRILTRPTRDWAWDQVSAVDRLRSIAAPSLFLSGWRDFVLGQTLHGFPLLGNDVSGSSAHHRLVVGNWDHQSLFYSFRKAKQGDTNHLDLLQLVGAWLERWLVPDGTAQAAAATADEPNVLLYVLGAQRWIRSSQYPPAEAQLVSWYLTADQPANTAQGQGRLVEQAPTQSGQDHFVYDPQNPVPSAGGAMWQFDPAGLVPGPTDQTEIETRPDVLVYTSAPLANELIVVGPITVELWASSSVADTDFTAKLVDVEPSGCALIVQDGIQRARYRAGETREVLLEPQRPHCLQLKLEAMAYRFAPGHRLRLEVSSSNFPRYDRHPNSAGPLHAVVGFAPAEQTVWHGGSTLSRLILSVLESAQVSAMTWHPHASDEAGDE